MKPSKLDIFKFIIAILAAGAFFKMGWEDVRLNSDFEKHGLKTPATLIGYQYWESSTTFKKTKGDIPLVSYATSNNLKLTHLALEYGVANEYQKKDLATKKIYITYLPYKPSKAVVYQWKRPGFQYAGYFWGSLFLIAGLAGRFRQLYLTHHSSGTPNGAP